MLPLALENMQVTQLFTFHLSPGIHAPMNHHLTRNELKSPTTFVFAAKRSGELNALNWLTFVDCILFSFSNELKIKIFFMWQGVVWLMNFCLYILLKLIKITIEKFVRKCIACLSLLTELLFWTGFNLIFLIQFDLFCFNNYFK